METSFFILHVLFGLVIAGVSAGVTFFLIRNLNVFDVPNERSSHTKATPIGAGIGMVGAFLVGILLIHFIGDKTPIIYDKTNPDNAYYDGEY